MDCPHLKQCLSVLPKIQSSKLKSIKIFCNIDHDNDDENDKSFSCSVCKSYENPWICINCQEINCGRYVKGHAKSHFEQLKNHCISVHCYSFAAYCYVCDDFINISSFQQQKQIQHLIQKQLKEKDNKTSSNDLDIIGTDQHQEKIKNVNDYKENGKEDESCSETSSNNLIVDENHNKTTRLSNNNTAGRPRNRNSKRSNSNNNNNQDTNKNGQQLSIDNIKNYSRKRNANSNTNNDLIVNQLDSDNNSNNSGDNYSKIDKKKIKLDLKNNASNSKGVKKKNNKSITNNNSKNSNNDSKINKKHGVVGLRNLGNTCFMAAVLQSLSKLNDFSTYIGQIPSPEKLKVNKNGKISLKKQTFCYSTRSQRKNRYLMSSPLNSLCNNNDTDNLSRKDKKIEKVGLISTSNNSTSNVIKRGGSNEEKIEEDEEFLIDELRKILVSLNTSGSSAVSPDGLFHTIWEVMPRFRGYQQQDAHEFLRYMLDRLHSELIFLWPKFTYYYNNYNTSNTNGIISKKGNNNNNSRLDKIFNSSSINPFGFKGRSSIVTAVFGGTLQNEVKCSNCGNESKKHDPFLDLSLDIPLTNTTSASNSSSNSTTANCQNNNNNTDDGASNEATICLEDCLSHFVEEELLSDNDMYFCSNCKMRQKSTKRFWIRRLPNVLCLHLKRFRFVNCVRNKLDDFVNFPLKNLDMSRYILNNIHGTRGSNTSSISGPHLYDLAAVIVHHGSGVGSGHYTAYAIKDEQWFHFNDSNVKAIEESNVAKCKAYILFYCRRRNNEELANK